MSLASRREALRKLAERPGTEHEGAVAREMLRRLDEKTNAKMRDRFRPEEHGAADAYQAYMRREMSVDAFLETLAKYRSGGGGAIKCACGESLETDGSCRNWGRHLEIQTEIRAKFKKGDRVLYNYHAYPADCAGKVAGYVSLRPGNGSFPWAWIAVKFDKLRHARQVPIYSAEGWHLKHAETELGEI